MHNQVLLYHSLFNNRLLFYIFRFALFKVIIETRQLIEKFLHGVCAFNAAKKLSSDKLPTCKEAIEVFYKKQIELKTNISFDCLRTDYWLWYKICALNVVKIKEKVFAVVDKFFKLSKWPKKQRKGKFLKEVKNFMANMPKLVDIFCENPQKRRALEIPYQLRITKDDSFRKPERK